MLPLARDQRGFSLAELLIVIAILGLMLTGLLAVQMQGQKAYLIGSHRVEAQQNGRVALELMVRELRSAQSVTLIPSATDITFVDENGSTIQYQLTGSLINRITGGVTTPLIGGVVAFSEHGIADGICKGNSCAQSAIDHESTANGAAWVANIGFVTGAILAATAVVVYVLDGKRRRQIAFTF